MMREALFDCIEKRHTRKSRESLAQKDAARKFAGLGDRIKK